MWERVSGATTWNCYYKWIEICSRMNRKKVLDNWRKVRTILLTFYWKIWINWRKQLGLPMMQFQPCTVNSHFTISYECTYCIIYSSSKRKRWSVYDAHQIIIDMKSFLQLLTFRSEFFCSNKHLHGQSIIHSPSQTSGISFRWSINKAALQIRCVSRWTWNHRIVPGSCTQPRDNCDQ